MQLNLQLNRELLNFDLFYHHILEFQLRLPHNRESQLAELTLSMSTLRNLTPTMIGHIVSRATRDNLLDSDVTDNKVVLGSVGSIFKITYVRG